MSKFRKSDFDDEDKKPKRVEKGRNKIEKHKKKIFVMASTLDPDDEAFDEYLEYEEVQQKRFKLR